MIPGYGMGNSLELNLQDMTGGELATFYDAAIQFLGALNERPEVAMAYTSYAINFPQISVEVDAAKCKRAGISPSAVLDAVGSYCGGAYISNYNQYGKVYRVMMQASPEYRLDEQALNNVCTQWYADGSGEPVRDAEASAGTGNGQPFQSLQHHHRQCESCRRLLLRRGAESD